MVIQIPTTKQGVLHALKTSLQTAIEIEFSTIPPYMYALGSLISEKGDGAKNKASEAVVVVLYEEMLHMGLACNLQLAIGGRPMVKGIQYYPPSPLPGHDQTTDPFTVGLDQFSLDAIVTFMQIELPEPKGAPPEAWNKWETIGQFYQGIEALIKSPVLVDADFRRGPQLPDPLSMYPKFNQGMWYEIRGKAKALQALNEIIIQGEGAQDSPYDNNLIDPAELAHYYQFRKIYLAMGGEEKAIGPRSPAERQAYLHDVDPDAFKKWKSQNIKRNMVQNPDLNRPDPTATAVVVVGNQEVEMTAKQAEDWFTQNLSTVIDQLNEGLDPSVAAIGEAIVAMAGLDPPLNACTRFIVKVGEDTFNWGPTFKYRPPKASGSVEH